MWLIPGVEGDSFVLERVPLDVGVGRLCFFAVDDQVGNVRLFELRNRLLLSRDRTLLLLT